MCTGRMCAWSCKGCCALSSSVSHQCCPDLLRHHQACQTKTVCPACWVGGVTSAKAKRHASHRAAHTSMQLQHTTQETETDRGHMVSDATETGLRYHSSPAKAPKSCQETPECRRTTSPLQCRTYLPAVAIMQNWC